MKTQYRRNWKVLFGALIISTLISIVSCNDQKNAESNNNASESKVKPPQVDIHTAVFTDNLEALKQHILAGTNLNEKDPFGGSSPLITASLLGKDEMVALLLEAGADINFKNNEGSTALHTAAFFCRHEIVQMLLEKGADKAIRNKFGATAYESVAGPFDEVKPAYDMMGTMLKPIGLKLDYSQLETARPEIAALLQ